MIFSWVFVRLPSCFICLLAYLLLKGLPWLSGQSNTAAPATPVMLHSLPCLPPTPNSTYFQTVCICFTCTHHTSEVDQYLPNEWANLYSFLTPSLTFPTLTILKIVGQLFFSMSFNSDGSDVCSWLGQVMHLGWVTDMLCSSHGSYPAVPSQRDPHHPAQALAAHPAGAAAFCTGHPSAMDGSPARVHRGLLDAHVEAALLCSTYGFRTELSRQLRP